MFSKDFVFLVYLFVLSYGDDTQILLTGNFKDSPGGWLFYLTTILTVIRTYVTVPPFLAVFAELFEVYFDIKNPRNRQIFRSTLLWVLAVLS